MSTYLVNCTRPYAEVGGEVVEGASAQRAGSLAHRCVALALVTLRVDGAKQDVQTEKRQPCEQ